jgi:hypothetical protein
VFYGPKWEAPPFFWRKPAENQQAKAYWKCYKKPLQKFYVRENKNIAYKNQQCKWIIFNLFHNRNFPNKKMEITVNKTKNN